MRVVLVFVSLYAVSVLGVVAGYSDVVVILSGANWSRLMAAVPVLRGAFANTAAAFVVLLIAYWLCQGERRVFNNATLGYSYFAPFAVVLLFLPGPQSAPPWAASNHYAMITIFCLAQVAATHLVRDWFWAKGGGDRLG